MVRNQEILRFFFFLLSFVITSCEHACNIADHFDQKKTSVLILSGCTITEIYKQNLSFYKKIIVTATSCKAKLIPHIRGVKIWNAVRQNRKWYVTREQKKKKLPAINRVNGISSLCPAFFLHTTSSGDGEFFFLRSISENKFHPIHPKN